MSRQDLADRSSELRAQRVPFVHARVVLAERPTSAKPGDEAIILPDGSIEGFVGGTCAETTVRDQSLAVLRSGQTLVLRITPTAESDQPGKRVVHNPCLSGGTLEVFLEPSVPPPLVVVVGTAPIAQALVAVGGALRYGMEPWSGSVPDGCAALVVASHGRGEETAITAALDAGVGYIGLVASAKRGQAVLDGLGLEGDRRALVHTPAGLDLHAGTPEEVALAILAEIVATRPHPGGPGPAPGLAGGGATLAEGAGPAGPARAVDPVCGMAVFPDADTPRVDHDGVTAWFCGRGCRDAFAADPSAYGA